MINLPLQLHLSFKKPQVIFQVGAYDGEDELIKACGENGHHLYLFEPNPHAFKKLVEKSRNYKTISVHPYAVSNYDGEAEFHLANFADCSSLSSFEEKANENWVHQWHPYKDLKMVDKVKVPVIRLDTFMAQEKIEAIDFIEIDTQGEDLRVVESLGEKIHQVKKIQIEVNIHESALYKNSFTKNEAMAFFKKAGFERHVSWKQSMNREENIIFRNKHSYPHDVVNLVLAQGEQTYRNLQISLVKLPMVLAVTKKMILQQLKVK